MIEPVEQFAEAMNSKLRERSLGQDDFTAPRGPVRYGWQVHCDISYLLRRLREELRELEKASGSEEISAEAVDVGNFAMMVWDRARIATAARARRQKAAEDADS